jgi:Tfp pilus assembly protein PilF
MDVRDITGTSCAIGIEWEKTSVVIPIQMDVARQAEMNIAKAIEQEQENWRVFRNSAQYYMNAGNMEEALVLIDRCLELDGSSWYSHWVRAQILHGLGKDDMAKEAGFNALEIGEAGAKEKGTEFSYKGMIRSTMGSW